MNHQCTKTCELKRSYLLFLGIIRIPPEGIPANKHILNANESTLFRFTHQSGSFSTNPNAKQQSETTGDPNVPESPTWIENSKTNSKPSNNTQFQTEEGEVKVMWLPPPPMWRTCEWWPPERCPRTCRGWGRSRRDCAQAQAPGTAHAPSHAASGCWHWSSFRCEESHFQMLRPCRNFSRTQLGFRGEREAGARERGESREISTESANNCFSFRPLGLLIVIKFDDYLN